MAWPTFLAVMARRLGYDTLFVLAYSSIQLNTDAHNPQLDKRMSRREFIENNRHSEDLMNLSEEYLANIYEEIHIEEIKIKDEDAATVMSSPADSVQEVKAFVPPMLGQDKFDVIQHGVGSSIGKSVSRKVQISVTGMGVTVFDTLRPVATYLYANLVSWEVSGSKVILVRTNGRPVHFETKECEALHMSIEQGIKAVQASGVVKTETNNVSPPEHPDRKPSRATPPPAAGLSRTRSQTETGNEKTRSRAPISLRVFWLNQFLLTRNVHQRPFHFSCFERPLREQHIWYVL